jgi:hypothetical protein
VTEVCQCGAPLEADGVCSAIGRVERITQGLRHDGDRFAEGLMRALRRLGDEYGPLGVAIVAATLTDPQVLVRQITDTRPRDPVPEPAEDVRVQVGADPAERYTAEVDLPILLTLGQLRDVTGRAIERGVPRTARVGVIKGDLFGREIDAALRFTWDTEDAASLPGVPADRPADAELPWLPNDGRTVLIPGRVAVEMGGMIHHAEDVRVQRLDPPEEVTTDD